MSISIPETANGKAAKIPRPMNAFMIFAKEHRPKVKKEHQQEENHVISIRLGNLWASLSQEEKDRYQELSREAASEHRRKYPDYRYEPKPKIKKKRRYDQYLLMDKLRTAAAEAAREQKEEQDKVKQSRTVVQRSAPNTNSVPTSGVDNYASSRSSWGHTNSATVSSPLPCSQSDGFPTYSQGYYYPSHPNVIPAHSQSSRNPPVIGPFGSIIADPYSLPYTSGVSSQDMPYMNQPLDMTTAGKTTQYKTQTTTSETSGKVYCDLTTQANRKTPPVPTHFIQNLSSRRGYPTHWADPAKMVPPTGQQINAQHAAPHLAPTMFSKSTGNQVPSSALSSKLGDGKSELVWIPCEADFARKLGWSLDPNLQGSYQSSTQ